MDALRDFMFERVYLGATARREHAKIERVVRTLFDFYAEDPARVPDGGGVPGADLAQRVTDYLGGMTDRYCIRAFEALAVPESFAV
jgi:dGTPase